MSMTSINYTPYQRSDRHLCMALFDRNCPQFFAHEERVEYEQFLDADPLNYWLVGQPEDPMACYGLSIEGGEAGINWIMVDPFSHRRGLGRAMVERALLMFAEHNASQLNVATSQHAVSFFERFGLIEISRTLHGWGLGMHRIDMTMSLTQRR